MPRAGLSSLEEPLAASPPSKVRLQPRVSSQGSLPRISSITSVGRSDDSIWKVVVDSGRFAPAALLLGCAYMTWLAITLQDPYLAPWALEHDMSGSQAGILYGVEPLTTVVVGALAPALGRRFGTARVLLVGLLLISLAFAGIAAAPLLAPGGGRGLWEALLGALAVGGVGEGLVEMNANVLILELFADVSGQMLGLAEAAVGLGSICGPLFGGVAFAIGGFSAGASAVACVTLLLALSCLTSLRTLSDGGAACLEDDEEASSGADLGPDHLVFALVLLGTFLAGAISSSYEPLASLHAVNDFGWSLATVGVVFSGYGVTYTAVSVLAGRWCDSSRAAPRQCFSCGAFVAALSSFLSSGSLTARPWDPAALTCGALLLGAADALLLVPSLIVLRQCAPGNWRDSNSSLVALDQSVFALGSAFGPMVLLPVGELVGFRCVMAGIASVSAALGSVSAPLMMRPGRISG
mmetsp:Transcript_86040/g.277906  ORF Transcript_86040/g.277906 Transcript_86040/m.277906 type:complete len:466 (-) Transcript_86040:67-1464(-)